MMGYTFFSFVVLVTYISSSYSLSNNASPTLADRKALVSPTLAPKTQLEKPRTSLLICPAQFCVPADYDALIHGIQKCSGTTVEIGTCKVAKLPRTEWIKVGRQLPTKSFLEAKLKARTTLDWYFRGMENALSEIYAQEGDDTNVCILGHSIGGWIGRAYLGGLSGSTTAVHRLTQQRCTSFITLGTPHSSPNEALVDQTRGLLREVEEVESCSSQAFSDRGIQVTCVGSSGVDGKLLTLDVEELVAATSYLPLVGKLPSTGGDGIVPADIAFMDDPARKVAVQRSSCGRPIRHAHIFPTPWNLVDGYARSLPLPDDFRWYGDVMEEWACYIK